MTNWSTIFISVFLGPYHRNTVARSDIFCCHLVLRTLSRQVFPRLGVREMRDARESPLTVPNYNTPVKDCLYWGKKYRYERFNVEWTWTLEKQLGRKGLSHLVKNHYQHHVVLIENVFNRNLLPWDIEFVIDESVDEQEEDIFHILLWWNWVNSKEPKLNCVYTEREILLFY